MSERPEPWPVLVHKDLEPMVDYVNRVAQVAGKYTLDEPFEVGWGNIVLEVTPRGLRTPTFRHPDVTFSVHYRLLDGDVLIETDKGSRSLPLDAESVAAFYAAYCETAAELGISRPRSSLICEIPDAPPTFEADTAKRTWDPDAARRIWQAMNLAAAGLEAWQAPFLGHRPRVGVMWGGFDLSATRFRAQHTAPPPQRPPFMQNAQLNAYVSVGFSFDNTRFNNADAPEIGMYAYIWPQPDGLEGRSWGVEGANWYPEAGLALLPWDNLRRLPDPHRAIVKFGEAVYDAAVQTAGWPPDLFGPRVDGWYASRTPWEVLERHDG
ncbi:DUF5996 family protein [Streptomyces sp. NBC_00820]|uniref:DUF5996 family protein n=1 Tax=Streptomyces sp. NBC_00820 TaxID=2975842 RepID=UPI002ED189D1|nr:DUF5996 family protein [Streptomyces sp. NBC_00820]